MRFLLEGTDAMGAKPFDILVPWYEDETSLSLLVDDNTPVKGCSLRECSMDLSQKRLYVTLYTPFPAQEVRHWFKF